MRVAGQDRREKLTMSAANVDDACERTEVIGFGNGLVAALAQSHHGTLKQGGLLWMFRQPVKPCAPEHLVKGWLHRTDRMKELLEGKIGLAVDHANEVTRAGPVGAQHGARLGQLEMSGDYLSEESFRREKSHYAIKRVGI